MLKKVRIKRVPQARTGYQVHGSLANDVPAMGGADYNAYIGQKPMEMSRYMTAVPREEANLEAEGGETVYGDINGDGMPEHKTIKGPRHSAGGVPLKLPEDTFIFSDTKSMKVKEPQLLAMFGKLKGSHTPATLAKQYDIERYRKILQDPNSDKLDRKTAELMLKNYTLKLGALALAQESKKGFPQGIPAVAKPYMIAMGIKEEDVLPEEQISETVKQLDAQQSNNQRSADTMASPTEQQDEEYGSQAEEAQMINSDRPVAQPMSEEDMAAGMTPEETQMRYGGMSQYARGGWMPEEIAVFTGEIPYAEYGMAMGANSQNYEGREKNMQGSGPMFYEKGGYLPKAQDGIVIDASSMTNEQLQRAIWDAKQKDPNVQITVTRKDEAGNVKKQKLKSVGFKAPSGADLKADQLDGFPDTPDGRAMAAQYLLIKKDLEDPTVRAEIIKNTKKAVDDPKAWQGKSSTTLDESRTWTNKYGTAPTDQEIIDAALNHQKRNLVVQANGIDPQLFSDIGERLDSPEKIVDEKYINPKTNKPYTLDEAKATLAQMTKDGYTDVAKTSNLLKVPLDPKGKDRVLQQATMHAYAKSYSDFRDPNGPYKDNPDAKYAMYNFLGSVSQVQAGANDETSMTALYGDLGNKISPLDDQYDYSDNWYQRKEDGALKKGKFTTYGDTTLGHRFMVGEQDLQYEDIPGEDCPCNDASGQPAKKDAAGNCPCDKPKPKKCPCRKSDRTVIEDIGIDPNTGECYPCEEDTTIKINKPAEWWLQDTIKSTGAFGDLMGVKKYMPWQSRIALETPRPTFLDPTRELAANAEQAKIQTQGVAQFAGPQAQSARASSIQGTSSKNAADILSRYNNANVNVANQFEMNATNIRNQGQMANQAAAQSFYDKNTIANQQFDNSKLALRNNARNQYTNAITNRAKTDAMNQLYPQYAVSPGTGGFMNFTEGKTVNGAGASKTKTYDEWLSYYKNDQKMSEAAAVDAAKNAYNSQNSTAASTDKAQVIKNAYGRLGGQMKKGGFVYGSTTFPFML